MRATHNFDHERKKIPLTILSSDHRKKASILVKIQFSIQKRLKLIFFLKLPVSARDTFPLTALIGFAIRSGKSPILYLRV